MGMNKNHASKLIEVCESQNHRCGVCGKPFPNDPLQYGKVGIRLYRVINDHQERGYDNCVATCATCIGRIGLYGTIDGLYEAMQMGAFNDTRSRPVFPDNVELFNRLIISRGLNPDFVSPNPNIIYADPSTVPTIASKVREHRPVVTSPVTSDHKRYIRRHVVSEKRKKKLLISQNNRCYYDDHEMELSNRETMRSYTVEHLIDVKDGGTNAPSNVVLACKICNNMREHLKMSSQEFKHWALTHRREIDERAKKYSK